MSDQAEPPLGDRAAIGWACERLVHLYAMLNDAGDFESMAALFTHDGAFARPSAPDDVIQGRDHILQALLARPPRFTRHLISSVVITVQSPVRASGVSYLTLHSGQPGADGAAGRADPSYLIGAFHDRFALEAGVWKFAERRGSLALKVG